MARASSRSASAGTRVVRLPITTVVGGVQHPPGTPVELPADEADAVEARFGSLPAPPADLPDVSEAT